MLSEFSGSKAARVLVSVLLSAVLCLNLLPAAAFAASEEPGGTGADENVAGEVSEADSAEDAPSAEPTETDEESAGSTEQSVTSNADSDKLGFAYLHSEKIDTETNQEIVVALSDESALIESARLFVSHDGKSEEYAASVLSENAARFTLSDLESGDYVLESFEYRLANSDSFNEIDLSVKSLRFSVEQVTDAGDATEVTAYSADSDGSIQENKDVSDAVASSLESGTKGRSKSSSAAVRAAASNVTVCVDAGHGGKDSGATGNGLKEKDPTLKIAKYAKEELEANGINVVMTRTDDTFVELEDRVEIAAKAGASYFMSIHINSFEQASASGSEVWVPNDSSYNKDTHVQGTKIGEAILEKLVALGLKERDVKTQDSKNEKYPNGDKADYYSVIRNSREHNITGFIVEHAFITNKNDAEFMKKEANLKKMGIADAQGLIEGAGIESSHLVKVDGGYKYLEDDGTYAKNEWKTVGGKTYYFGNNEFAVVYSQTIGGDLYYFNGSGVMQTGWVTWDADGRRSWFGPDGKAASGFAEIGGETYYFDGDHRMVVYSQTIGGKRYYFTGAGAMRTGWVTWVADGTRSYYGPDGAALSGFQEIDGGVYYLDPDDIDHRALRWSQIIDGKRYYFNTDGVMMTGWITWIADGTRSYFGSDGVMYVGTHIIDGVEYTFDENGRVIDTIMGFSHATAEQMVALYKSKGHAYPSSVYKGKGASSIEEFCKIVVEEAEHEGVRADLVFCQAMWETGWLQFGGDVKAEQCNFAGIGAVGGGAGGATFKDVRTGIRAQVQHLKAYGSTDPLNNECVDPRFYLVERGSALLIRDLGGKWASDKNYGDNILKLMADLMQCS